MGDGRWEMGDGRWEMGDGRWEMGWVELYLMNLEIAVAGEYLKPLFLLVSLPRHIR